MTDLWGKYYNRNKEIGAGPSGRPV